MTVDYRVGDTRTVIKEIADGSIDFVCTSPPFLALRSYVPADHESKGDEIGSERNPAEFIDMLLGLTAEWGRVLAAHGSIAIELGDTYSGSGGGGGDYLPGGLREGQAGDEATARAANAANWRQKNQPEAGRIGRVGLERDPQGFTGRSSHGAPGGSAWPRAKSLALIPQLYAVALAYGINPLTGQASPAGRWLVRNVVVWHRSNPAVGALGDKVRPSTSYIVVATRSAKRWFDLTAIRQPHKGDHKNGEGIGNGKAGEGGSNAFGRNVTVRQMDPAGAPPLDAWFDSETTDVVPFDPYDGTHDTWTLTTQPSRLAHYAMWPAKLAERLILSMCPREVCTVCGEPRRRIEVTTNAVGKATAHLVHLPSNVGRDFVMSWPSTSERETLGWTDCGCLQCPTCGASASLPLEMICSDHRPDSHYRPGLTLDPFAGSGTTLAVADLHGRDAIGVDFDARNKAIYPARYDEVKRALYGTPAPMPGQETFDFEEETASNNS